METIIIYPLSFVFVIGGIILLIGLAANNSIMDLVLNNFAQTILIASAIIGIITAVILIKIFICNKKISGFPFLLIPANAFALSQFLFSLHSCMQIVDGYPDNGFILLWKNIVFFVFICYLFFNAVGLILATGVPIFIKNDGDYSAILAPVAYGALGWLIILIAFLLGRFIS